MLILPSPTYAKAIGFRSGLAKSFHLVKYAYDDMEYIVDRVISAITYVFIDLKEIHNIITVPHT